MVFSNTFKIRKKRKFLLLNKVKFSMSKIFMNYQLLIESYSFGTALSEQEIALLSLELETQIININISTEFGCFKSAPSHI